MLRLLNSSGTEHRISVVDETDQTVFKGILGNEPVDVKLPHNQNYIVYGNNVCGLEEEVATTTTFLRKRNDPIVLSRFVYEELYKWQRLEGIPLPEYLDDNSKLSHFEKLLLFQQLAVRINYLDDAEADAFTRITHLKGKRDNEKSGGDGCCCNAVIVSQEQAASPANGVHPNGYIFGQPEIDESRLFEDRSIRTDLYGYYKGPARYQELFARTTKCEKPERNYFYNQNSGQATDVRDLTLGDLDEQEALPLQFTSEIEWNWVCRDDRDVAVDCGCERIINFDWDYESVVRTQAETVSGGLFCGRNRAASAAAVDAAMVAFSERNNPSSFRVLGRLANGQVSECGQEWTGPSVAEFMQFAFEVYLTAQGSPVPNDTTTQTLEELEVAWQNDIGANIAGQVDDWFSEPWLSRSQCSAEIAGRRRSMRQNRREFPTDAKIRLRPNQPVRVVLGAAGNIEIGGLRKWTGNASIHSSYRLASVMQGGGNPLIAEEDDCCSPYMLQWMLGAVAEGVVGGTTEENLEDNVEGFFAIMGYPYNVFRESGRDYTYQNYQCPGSIEITDIGVPTSVSFETYFTTTQVGNEIRITANHSIQTNKPVKVYNINGQMIKALSVPFGGEAILDVNDLPAGMYILSSMGSDHSIISRKIILQ